MKDIINEKYSLLFGGDALHYCVETHNVKDLELIRSYQEDE